MAAKALQFRFQQQTYLFNLKVGFSLLCLTFFILCCTLGSWQLHRYTDKKTLLTQYQQRLTSQPIPLSQLTVSAPPQFQRISVSGFYLNELTMLVQNRFYHDQLGYEVLTPLRIPGQQKLLLIDRGWIQKPNTQSLPTIENVSSTQDITGYIKLLNEHQFILGKNILAPKQAPLVMQRIDLYEISSITQQSFYPFILRLDANQTNGFVRDWIIASVTPERHMGYAVQWFALAFVLFIAYFCFCCERKGKSTHAA